MATAARHAAGQALPRSLVWATDIDVLPPGRIVQRRERYLVVRSPSNPLHYWGNFLIFDEPPRAGDAPRWEELFEREFADEPLVAHRVFAWDRADGELGAAREEFVARSYELERSVGLAAELGALRPHPRANREVHVRTLDPRARAEEELWEQVVEIWVASHEDPAGEELHRDFSRRRLAELREMFAAGAGAWYVAIEPAGGAVVASCGIVTTGPRGRFQAVDTHTSFRRRGICSRLLIEACRHSASEYGARRFVIAADPGYHALGLYESLGFEAVEQVAGVCLKPASGSDAETPTGPD
jgi:ribosomal protein S18 acetylase RimI-like enzyme